MSHARAASPFCDRPQKSFIPRAVRAPGASAKNVDFAAETYLIEERKQSMHLSIKMRYS
jgi:hypothetical protein